MVLQLRLSVFLQAICTVFVCLSLVCLTTSVNAWGSSHYSGPSDTGKSSSSSSQQEPSKLDFLRSLQRSLELTETVSEFSSLVFSIISGASFGTRVTVPSDFEAGRSSHLY